MDTNLIEQVTRRAEQWLSPAYDAETQAEVRRMLDNPDKSELIDAFYKDLEFGTAGLRGVMGAGTNRMNIYTVGAATQGLSNYLNGCFAGKPISVVIGYDCRNNSSKFARISADIFAANGIRVYLFDDMRPTPEMSFAIRHLGCQSGIILTASHNPKEYNGYKAYWDDGAQILPPHDSGIIAEVKKITDVSEIRFHGGDESLIHIIGKEIDDAYLQAVRGISLHPELRSKAADIKVVYTPLHGTGMMLIPRALREWGFEALHCVPEQMVKDGNFPTVAYPNPEDPAAMKMAVDLAKQVDADLVMASDPDADRMGMACKNDKGEWILLNGNQSCALFLYYIISQYKALGRLTGKEFVVKTIVTTELIHKMAAHNGIPMFDCYTGFKWIAREIRIREGKMKYIGGGEESYGFLAEDFVRDKDAVSACCLMAEIAAWAAANGKSLFDLLQTIYREYGFSKEKGISVVEPGKSGAERIQEIMADFRQHPLTTFAGSPVVLRKDFKTLQQTDAEGKTTAIDMPATADVLQYFTENGDKLSVRPSGTEPKIKFYLEIKGKAGEHVSYDLSDAAAERVVEQVRRELGEKLHRPI